MGKDVSDSSVYVDVGKILPFERGSGCKISCIGGESWLASSSFVGTSIWKDMVQRILFDMGLRTVLIIGKSDTGKSTFAVYLINEALQNGFRLCIIDADIGQGDLSPPNAIGGTICLIRLPTYEKLIHDSLSLSEVSLQLVLKKLSSKQSKKFQKRSGFCPIFVLLIPMVMC